MRPLADIKEGETVCVASISCGRGIKHRLCTLGVSSGQKLKVIKNDSHGAMIVEILDSKLVIGRGEASKISVE